MTIPQQQQQQQQPTPAPSVSSHTLSPPPPSITSSNAPGLADFGESAYVLQAQTQRQTQSQSQPRTKSREHTLQSQQRASQQQQKQSQYHIFPQQPPSQKQSLGQGQQLQQQPFPPQAPSGAYPAPPPPPQTRNPLHPSILPLLSPDFVNLYNSTLQYWPPPPTDLQTIRANYSGLYRFAARTASGVGGIGETHVPGWSKYPGDIPVRVYVPPGDLDGLSPGIEAGKKGTTDIVGDGKGESEEKREGKEKGERGVWPVHFNFHGGGWAVGDLETSAHTCHHICASVPCCVIDVEYRLIPEYPFPIGIMDALSAVAHILVNHKTFSIDSTRFTLGGESSGGTIALILNHILRDGGMGDRLKGVIAGTPTISDVRKYATPDMSPWPSMRESQYTPLLNWEKLKWFDTFKWMSLSTTHPGVSAKEMKKDVGWYADAMNAPDFKNLAPLTWVGTAECDPLRDEAEAYADKCQKAGNNVVVKRFKGMPHGFVHMDGLLPSGWEYVEDVIDAVRQCLYRKEEDGDVKGEEKKGTEGGNDGGGDVQVESEGSERGDGVRGDRNEDEIMSDVPGQ